MMPLLVDCINSETERRQNEIEAFDFAFVSEEPGQFAAALQDILLGGDMKGVDTGRTVHSDEHGLLAAGRFACGTRNDSGRHCG